MNILYIEKLIKKNFPLKNLSTYRVGGPAEYYIEPTDEEQVLAALKWADEKGIRFHILGGGSNVLIHDDGIDGLVINTRNLNRISIKKKRQTNHIENLQNSNKKWSNGEIINLIAQCGAQIDTIVDKCAEYGYTGFEEFAGLPGTVGGAVYMNAKVYGKSISDLLKNIRVFEKDNGKIKPVIYHISSLSFEYKKSPFQNNRTFIIEADFIVKAGKIDEVKKLTSEYRSKREKLGQYDLPNAGCVFKNNREFGKPTGMIIEELGLKGRKIGGAKVFEKHANFIVNTGNATAVDIYKLIRLIEEEVEKKLGLKLEREIRLLGKWEDL